MIFRCESHTLCATAVLTGARQQEIVAYFLLLVWLTPFIFFVSLSANENALPLSGGGGQWGSPSMTPQHGGDGGGGGKNKSSSLIKSIIGKAKMATDYVSGNQKTL